MKLNWRIIIILFLGFGILEIIVKGSNVVPITSLEPLIILALSLSTVSSSWSIVLVYIYTAFLVDIINYQMVGMGGLAFFAVALILNFINRFIDLVKEHKYIYAVLILLFTLIAKLFLEHFLMQTDLTFNILSYIINLVIFSIVFLLVKSFNTESVFKR